MVRTLLISSLLIFVTNAHAQIILNDTTSKYTLGRRIDVLADPTHQLRTLRQVTMEPYCSQFMRSKVDIPNYGFSTYDYWVRFDLADQTTTSKPWLLEISFGNFSEIDLYFVSKRTGKVIKKRGGELLGKKSREVSYNTYVFQLPVDPNDEQTVFIRLSSTFGQATFPLYIWRTDAFVQVAQLSGLLWGVYYGVFLAVFLYHLALLLLLREKNHLYYLTVYLGAYMLYELSRGYCLGVRFIWTDNQWLTVHSLSTFFTLMISCFLLFYSSVLGLKKAAPRLHTVLYVLVAVGLVGWLITLINLPNASENFIITAVGLVDSIFIIFLGAYSWKLGYEPARYYWAAAVIIFLGGFIHSLNRAGIIPGSSFFVHYTLNLGSLLEFILLTVGLADTMRIERKQRKELEQEIEHQVESAELRGLTEERQRVSSEIHDHVGNALLTLRRSIQGLKTSETTTTSYEKLDQIVQETYNEVRKIVNNMLPDEFQQKGLSVAIRELIDSMNTTDEMHFYLLLSGTEDKLLPNVQFQLYMIIVELINNVIKHAQATEASIRSTVINGVLTISVRDNGIGISLVKLEGGRGWSNIHNRLARIGGTIQIDTLGSKGTSLIIHIPFK